jgi:carboxypeptidase family protein
MTKRQHEVQPAIGAAKQLAGKCALIALMIVTPVVAFAQGARSLVISVQDAEGRPLKNACITFVTPDGPIIFRKADARGRVKLKDLPAHSGRVIAKVDGYEAQKQSVTLLSETETITFRLQPRSK